MSRASYPKKMMLYYMASYTVTAIYQSYSSVYFASQGLDHAKVGIIQAAAPLVSIIAQPLWGILADKSANKNWVLRGLILVSALTVCAYPLEKSFPLLLIGVAVFSFFQIALQPLADSIVLDHLNDQHQPFGPLRLSGTAAFALMTLLAGKLFDASVGWIPLATAAALALSLAASFTLPATSGCKGRHQPFPTPFALLKNRNLMLLLSFVALMQITMGFFYTFFSVYFTDQLGGSKTLLGWAYFLASLSEFPFLLLGDKLFNKLGAGRLLGVCALSLILRWGLIAWVSTPIAALFTQVLHGWGFIVMMFVMAKYISLEVAPELRSSGQMLLGMVSYGLARVAGSLLGGFLSNVLGMKLLFAASAALVLLAFLTLGCYLWRKKI